MLRLRILAVLAVALAVVGGAGFTAPSAANTPDQDAVAVDTGDTGLSQGDAQDNAEEPKAKRDRPPSYRDKLEARNTPKAPPRPPAKPKYKKSQKSMDNAWGIFTGNWGRRLRYSGLYLWLVEYRNCLFHLYPSYSCDYSRSSVRQQLC